MRKLLYFAFIAVIGCYACNRQEIPGKGKPNIIIIYADDLGYGDLSSYGGDIPTPNIDRIGQEGIRFTDFYVAAPVCTPSRYALLTGSYPNRSQHQLQNVLFPFDEGHLDKSETTLAEYLKSQDYTTAIIGKWHLGLAEKAYSPIYHGFDKFFGHLGGCIDFYYHTYGELGMDWYEDETLFRERGYATDILTAHALDFVDDQAKDGSDPFFLYLPFNAPHYGKSDPDSLPENTVVLNEAKYKGHEFANTLQAPVEYLNKFSHVEDPYRRAYSAMVSNLDDNVGRLLQKLKDKGLLENTMIWFISDNGGYSKTHHAHASNGSLRGQKGSLWEGGIRVPALVCWKNKIKNNQVINTPLINVDIVPTIGAMVGFEKALDKAVIDGKDISKVLFNGEALERDIFWKFNKQSAIRSGDWKLVNGTELYNLRTDRSESRNMASSRPEKVNDLQKRFQEVYSTLGRK